MAHPDSALEGQGGHPGMPAAAHHPAGHAQAVAAALASPRSAAPAPQHARGGLFADPNRGPVVALPAGVPAEPRPSLFRAVTGRLRNSLAAAGAPAAPAEPAQPRAEPAAQEHRPEPAPRASVRQAAGEEMGLEIPAFLRRQSS
jgi:cell division protein FtsZ